MTLKRFVIGTVVGGLTVLATGYLMFATALRDFYASALNAGSATGVQREPVLLWAVVVGAISYGALLTLAIDRPSTHPRILTGAATGAIVGGLMWITSNFMLYGVTNVGDLTSTLLTSLIELVPGTAAGAVVAFILGKLSHRSDYEVDLVVQYSASSQR
jgi:ABC-type nitrate/sulfonate/bicarbonate transport system permease component